MAERFKAPVLKFGFPRRQSSGLVFQSLLSQGFAATRHPYLSRIVRFGATELGSRMVAARSSLVPASVPRQGDWLARGHGFGNEERMAGLLVLPLMALTFWLGASSFSWAVIPALALVGMVISAWERTRRLDRTIQRSRSLTLFMKIYAVQLLLCAAVFGVGRVIISL